MWQLLRTLPVSSCAVFQRQWRWENMPSIRNTKTLQALCLCWIWPGYILRISLFGISSMKFRLSTVHVVCITKYQVYWFLIMKHTKTPVNTSEHIMYNNSWVYRYLTKHFKNWQSISCVVLSQAGWQSRPVLTATLQSNGNGQTSTLTETKSLNRLR